MKNKKEQAYPEKFGLALLQFILNLTIPKEQKTHTA